MLRWSARLRDSLARFRLRSETADYAVQGLRKAQGVARLGIGGHGAEPDEARRVFDGYVEAGGNFIDTLVGSSCRLIYAENP